MTEYQQMGMNLIQQISPKNTSNEQILSLLQQLDSSRTVKDQIREKYYHEEILP